MQHWGINYITVILGNNCSPSVVYEQLLSSQLFVLDVVLNIYSSLGLLSGALAKPVKGRVLVSSHWQSVSMSASRIRLRRASISLNLPKHDLHKTSARSHGLDKISPSGSNLTPDIQVPTSQPLLLDPAEVGANFVRINNYLLSGAVKDNTANSHTLSSNCSAVNIITEEQLICKV